MKIANRIRPTCPQQWGDINLGHIVGQAGPGGDEALKSDDSRIPG
jgi:hypothetical protein